MTLFTFIFTRTLGVTSLVNLFSIFFVPIVPISGMMVIFKKHNVIFVLEGSIMLQLKNFRKLNGVRPRYPSTTPPLLGLKHFCQTHSMCIYKLTFTALSCCGEIHKIIAYSTSNLQICNFILQNFIFYATLIKILCFRVSFRAAHIAIPSSTARHGKKILMQR